MLKFSSILFLLSCLLFSCSEEFVLNIPDNNKRLVLEGAITNEEGPYFFKLSFSQNLSINKDNSGITDAFFVISDDVGISDTLKLLPTNIQRHPKWYYYFITVKKYSGVSDTIRLTGGDTTILRGVYYTTKIQGRPGNQYSLKIIYKNSTIQASEEMPYVPAIDSVQFREQFLEKDSQNYYVPFLYFKEPQDQTNFYMFNFGSDNLYNLIYSSARVWNFSILDDTFLTEYVNGFNLDDGASPVGFLDFFYFNKGDKAIIRMLSLSENAYKYYEALLKQFENDGGAYSPTPASPPTNLTGNALGYFRVSAVSEIDLTVK
jgi:hypothetical protein